MWKRRGPPTLQLAPEPGSEPDPLVDLARRARDGDAAAVHALLVAVIPSLLRVARQILGPGHPEVNDVTQEAACGVLAGLPRFREECTLLHFACRIAVLTSMNARRRERSRAVKARGLSELSHFVAENPPTPEQLLLGQRAAEVIRELLASLPKAQAEVLGLHHVVGLTAAEIAGVTGAPLETVRSRLRLGRQALQQRVQCDQRLLEAVGMNDDQPR